MERERIMRTEVVRSACLVVLGAVLAACGGAANVGDEDALSEGALRGRELTEAEPAPAPGTAVPSLDCAGKELLGRPEYTATVRPTNGGGTMTVSRWYLLDGQTYRVGLFDVTATRRTDESTGAELLVLVDTAGRDVLEVEGDGTARAFLLSPYGFSLVVPLTCR